jgi:hypothetical protein
VAKIRVKLVLELVTWPARASSLGTTGLDHEIRDHPVKGEAVVITLAGEFNKILHRVRDLLPEEFQANIPAVCLDRGN